jgi:hypothetical protein
MSSASAGERMATSPCTSTCVSPIPKHRPMIINEFGTHVCAAGGNNGGHEYVSNVTRVGCPEFKTKAMEAHYQTAVVSSSATESLGQ